MVSSTFLVLRLIVLLAQKADLPTHASAPKAQEGAINSLWNRFWPDWSRVVSLSADEACVNSVSFLLMRRADSYSLYALSYNPQIWILSSS